MEKMMSSDKILQEEQFFWFSLRVVSGKERIVEENIMYESKISEYVYNGNKIEDEIEEVFVPYEKIVKIKNNKKVIKERVFFPGYILIKMRLNKVSKYFIENIQGVMSFVGPKGKNPIPLRESEIKKIFGEVERKEGREMIVSPFKKDDSVKIIAGPFVDFSGVVEEINDDKQKVKVVISIFGRSTPVELDYFQVESER
jgi:transcriptional antiterminator NusG